MNNPQRYHALDIFRGMTIALMILVNTPGNWTYVYFPFRHAEWHGLTLTDLVFPFFLFIVGTAMMFSFSKYDFRRTKKVYQKIAKRTAIIFLIGLLGHLYGTLVHGREIENFRIMGVLQRIALCYGIAAVLVLRFKLQHLWIILIAALIGYWQLLLWNGGYALETNFARTFDMVILGSSHLYKGTGIPFDPEGLLSTIPSIMTVLLGFFAGVMIHSATDQVDNVKKMLILGALLIVTGWLWSFVFPINKQLWTSSYVLVTGGIAFMVLAALIWVIDINAVKKPFFAFEIFGTNSLFVYAASGVWTNTMLWLQVDNRSLYSFMYTDWFVPLAGNMNGSFLFALANVVLWWLILYIMYRKKIFIKI